MASPLVGVPFFPFALSIFLGLIPYHYITVSVGATLGDIHSIFDWSSILTLLAAALMALVPTFVRKQRQTTGTDATTKKQKKTE